MKNPEKKILLAMSGGTDSSVAAIMLLEQGYEVEGLTLMIHSGKSDFIDDAASLCNKLGIKHHVVDVRTEFKNTVIQYFIDDYKNGRTPNPCIYCNENLKWAVLAGKGDELGIKLIATGHYARIERINSSYFISKGSDPAKDQSYFLWRLPQSILDRAVLPLGNLTKSKVKRIAEEKGFKHIAHKRESMGICFLQETSVHNFLEELIPKNERPLGEIITSENDVVGSHSGLPFYTIGQKKGIGVHNLCVIQIDTQKNQLIVGDPETLWTDSIELKNFHFVSPEMINENSKYHVRIRGVDRKPYYEAQLKQYDNTLKINFDDPIWAPTSGQSVVIYENDLVIGGGIL